ncbi:MAG: flavoprotein [Candidatus Eisenbacteria bacterium]
MTRVLVGISGASGAAFAVDFLRRCPGDKYLVVSDWGKALLKDELDLAVKDLAPYVKETFSDHDLSAPFASGSNRYDAFVVVPCSASTLSKISFGVGDTLITRATQVALKERMRPPAPVETPSRLNAESAPGPKGRGIIVPIMPPFITSPRRWRMWSQAGTAKLLALAGVDPGPGWREDRL